MSFLDNNALIYFVDGQNYKLLKTCTHKMKEPEFKLIVTRVNKKSVTYI
jgi:hypothetical protein